MRKGKFLYFDAGRGFGEIESGKVKYPFQSTRQSRAFLLTLRKGDPVEFDVYLSKRKLRAMAKDIRKIYPDDPNRKF